MSTTRGFNCWRNAGAKAPRIAFWETRIHLNGEWPTAEELAKADSIVIYADGGGGPSGDPG